MDVHINLRQLTANTRHLGFSLVRRGLLLALCLAASFAGVAQVERVEHYLNTANNLVFEAPDSSRVMAKHAIALAEDIQNDTLIARGYHLLGLVEAVQGNYSLSQEYSLKALGIFEKYQLLKRQSGTLSNIAGVIIEEERYRDAIVYLKQSLKLDEQLGDGAGIASDYNNLGVAYRKLNLPDSARYYYNLEFQHAAQLDSTIRGEFMARANYNIGYTYILQKKYEQAKQHLQAGHAYYRRVNDTYALSYGLWYEARLAYETGASHKGIQIAHQGLAQANRLKLDEVRLNLFAIMSDAHAALQRYDSALYYQKQHQAVTDSMYTNKKARMVAELQYVYETEKKDREILVLKKEEQRNRLITITIGIAAIAAFFLLTVIYLSKRLQTIRHREREAHLQAEHEKAQREKYRIQAEKDLQAEKNKQLQLELESSQRELATTTLFIQQKNNLLETLQEEIQTLSHQTDDSQKKQLVEMGRNLQHHINFEGDWSKVIMHFEKVHPQFFEKLKALCPDLTMNELRQAAYIRINLTNKEVAQLMNVDTASVKMSRYRIKKKLNLQAEESLSEFIRTVG
jgi:DNA-binding CsgD family transcriptional regulator